MEIRRARDDDERREALELRAEVFVGEQGVAPGADRDGRDDDAVQLVAVTEEGEVVGTCRLLIEAGSARFGRLAVRRAARGRGLGASLLAEAEREARAAGAEHLGLHAQTRALSLYERAGYRAYGEPFDEEGIEHVAMEKPLSGSRPGA